MSDHNEKNRTPNENRGKQGEQGRIGVDVNPNRGTAMSSHADMETDRGMDFDMDFDMDGDLSELEASLGGGSAKMEENERVILTQSLEGFASCFPEWDLHPPVRR